jgi:monothiol glutaredoxin
MFSRLTPIFRRSFASGSHPDFARRVKTTPASEKEVHERIAKDLKAADVVVYMKGVPEAPQCGFSQAVCKVLKAEGVDFAAHNVLADAALRDFVKTYTDWPTIPQVFVKGEFVGGCDILVSMYQNGELGKMLQDKGIKKTA